MNPVEFLGKGPTSVLFVHWPFEPVKMHTKYQIRLYRVNDCEMIKLFTFNLTPLCRKLVHNWQDDKFTTAKFVFIVNLFEIRLINLL